MPHCVALLLSLWQGMCVAECFCTTLWQQWTTWTQVGGASANTATLLSVISPPHLLSSPLPSPPFPSSPLLSPPLPSPPLPSPPLPSPPLPSPPLPSPPLPALNASLALVSCADYTDVCSHYAITSYPGVKLFHSSAAAVSDYTGVLDARHLLQALGQESHPQDSTDVVSV